MAERARYGRASGVHAVSLAVSPRWLQAALGRFLGSSFPVKCSRTGQLGFSAASDKREAALQMQGVTVSRM